MSKRKHRRRASSNKSKQRGSSSSLAIPIAVGVAVVAIILGVIMLRENQQSTAAALPGDVSGAAGTALPLSTNAPPNPEVPRATLDGTRDKMEKGEAVLVDVRSKASYDKAHAAGSVSIPEAEVYARLSELPRDKEIVLYCTWSQEQQSARVAQQLMGQGFTNVSALLGGFAAWQRAGLPIESTTQ